MARDFVRGTQAPLNPETVARMKMAGMSLAEIAEALDSTMGCVSTCWLRYRKKHGIEASKRKRPEVTRVHKPAADPALRWHRMHCGRGMRSEDIARVEGVPVDTVRETLQKYRQEKWGWNDQVNA